MPKIVYGLVDADFPTIPFSIKPGEARELPEDEDDARTILESGHVSETAPVVPENEELNQNQKRPLSKSEERRLAASKYPDKGETE